MMQHTAEGMFLSEMLGGACPRCRQPLQNHGYQLFASTVADADRRESLLRFFQLAKAHDWKNLRRHQDFDGTKNVAQIYALKCPLNELLMLYVRNPFEPLDSELLEAWEALDRVEAVDWSALLQPERWLSFGASVRP